MSLFDLAAGAVIGIALVTVAAVIVLRHAYDEIMGQR
jgi:hypothetical protein